jgi:hypothetical protein
MSRREVLDFDIETGAVLVRRAQREDNTSDHQTWLSPQLEPWSFDAHLLRGRDDAEA